MERHTCFHSGSLERVVSIHGEEFAELSSGAQECTTHVARGEVPCVARRNKLQDSTLHVETYISVLHTEVSTKLCAARSVN